MKRKFFVYYESEINVYSEKELKNFFNVAIINNRDISEFSVIEIDSRLDRVQANVISHCLGDSDYKVIELMDNGVSPYEALVSVFPELNNNEE